ncbi:Trp biosynthesis-associated membrane protein, partial [Dietzia sp. DQ12-76]
MSQSTRLRLPVVLLVLGAALLWIASRMVWVDVVAFNDQSGEVRRALTGSQWQPALVAVALGALAAVAAVALVRGTGARVVGAVIALLGLA